LPETVKPVSEMSGSELEQKQEELIGDIYKEPAYVNVGGRETFWTWLRYDASPWISLVVKISLWLIIGFLLYRYIGYFTVIALGVGWLAGFVLNKLAYQGSYVVVLEFQINKFGSYLTPWKIGTLAWYRMKKEGDTTPLATWQGTKIYIAEKFESPDPKSASKGVFKGVYIHGMDPLNMTREISRIHNVSELCVILLRKLTLSYGDIRLESLKFTDSAIQAYHKEFDKILFPKKETKPYATHEGQIGPKWFAGNQPLEAEQGEGLDA